MQKDRKVVFPVMMFVEDACPLTLQIKRAEYTDTSLSGGHCANFTQCLEAHTRALFLA